MPSINKVQLIGNITADTELKLTQKGKKVANFTIATNEQWKNTDGVVVRNANFHKAVSWNGLADYASKVCTKGRLVFIEGKLVNRSYDTTDKTKRYVTEISVTGIRPLNFAKSAENDDVSELPIEEVETVEEQYA